MNKEQALNYIENAIFAAVTDLEKGIAIGFIDACFFSNLISDIEFHQFRSRVFGN
ncbi:hypothetical protein [Acinetobacter sp. MD2]|uniref:hypothetical protein n=1 Tax=Acinetobacter sp. MD2 TaxID=2600066 RepID=UPI002D1F73B8|nr:hypothetical protein [Acinetobacter sp. MD2]MEB3766500.1 hypothetical protein [Acinetobacter sp. MD2]